MSADGRVEAVERIAVLRANAIGDLVFSLPALEALRVAYPDAELVLLAGDWPREFLRSRPSPVDRVVAVPPARGVREDGPEDAGALDRFFAAMRAERFDLALQMHGGGRWSNPFVLRLGARVTAGLRAAGAPALDRCVPYVYYQPEYARYLEVAALVGAPPVTIAPRLAVTAADRDEAERRVGLAAPFAVLHPGATDPRRRWPAERFAAVGDALAADGLAVVVTGTPDERAVVEAVLGAMRADARVACGTLSLGGLLGLLARATLVVSNDTGPLHLAGAVGTPSVGIYWIGNLVNGGPLERALHRPLPCFRVHCPVCGVDCTTGECEHDASFVADVPVADAVAAARELVAGLPATEAAA